MEGCSARNRVFSFLCRRDQSSRPEIAQALSLSMPTVLKASRELLDRGLIYEAGELASTGGRKARALSCRGRCRHAVGVDVTRGHISFVLVDVQGQIVQSRRIQRPFVLGAEYAEGISREVKALLRESRTPGSSVLGVGVSVPAIVDTQGSRIEDSHVLSLADVPLERLVGALPYPCTLLNDADAAAAAQVHSQGEVTDLVYLSLSGSVGGAVYVDGRPYRGQNQRAGEFGHMCVQPDGEACYCGKRGCLDAYCSSHALSSHAPDGRLETFFSLLDAGVPEAQGAWLTYKKALLTAINSLRMVLDCPIVLGGYVGAQLAGRMDEIRLDAAALNTFETDCDYILPCHHRYEASALGAALHFIDAFISGV